MSDTMRNQSTDAANAAGFGTTKLSERQPDVLKASPVQDGGASGKGKKEPADTVGVRH